MALLERARAAVAERDARRAITELLDVWRRVPDARLALAIAELVRHAADRRPGAGLQRWRASEWDAACARRDPVDYDVLLSNIVFVSAELAASRLAALAEWPRDPRLGEWLARWIDAPPLSSRSSLAFWDAVTEAVATSNDPRVIAAVSRAGFERGIGTTHVRERVGHRLRDAVVRLRAALPAVTELAADDRALCDELLADSASWDAVQRSRDEMEAMFVARIRADPADDGARLVFADWLQLHDDPRGELIALGFARRDGRDNAQTLKRERHLLRHHAAAWLGGLDAVVGRKSMAFERGFLSGVTVTHSGRLAKATGDPAWSTVESIAFAGPMINPLSIVRAVGDPVMRALRSVSNITLDVLEGLLATPTAAQLEHVAVVASHGDRDVMLDRLAGGVLPRLRELHWTDAPTAKRLAQVVVLPCETVTLLGVSSGISLRLERADSTRWHLEVRPSLVQLEAIVESQRERFASITIAKDRRPEPELDSYGN